MEKITHQQARNMLQDLVDRPQPSKRQAQLDAHLAECGDCNLYAEHLHQLENNLRRVMQESWHGQHANISIVAIQTRSRRLRMRSTLWNSVRALAAIALLACILIIVNSFLNQPYASPPVNRQATQQTSTSTYAIPTPIGGPQNTNISYLVQPGDTWVKIASLFNVSSLNFIELNGLKSDCSDIYPGQVLRIPILPDESHTIPTAVTWPPASGEWVAPTDFGKLELNMNTTGTRITKISYQFSNWTCGSNTFPGEIVDSAGWIITANQLSVVSTFDREALVHMYVDGTYDPTDQKFYGTWELVVANTTTICSGRWEASAPWK